MSARSERPAHFVGRFSDRVLIFGRKSRTCGKVAGTCLEVTDSTVTLRCDRFRRGRWAVLTRCCAALLAALILCPFTAPFATYDPNAATIGVQDGASMDACNKEVTVVATPMVVSDCTHVTDVALAVNAEVAFDVTGLRFAVLRI
jgi:hypothetical protein